jgi:mandelamide amidase
MKSPTRREFLHAALAVSAVPLAPAVAANRADVGSAGRDLLELTATEAVSLLRSGDLVAETYAQALLQQCHRHRNLNAFIWQDEDRVLEAARAADKRRSQGRIGPLHGLPILVKDNIDTSSAPTTAGTPALRDHRPSADATVAASLFSAGAILLGKTNMHELAVGITSNNAAFGAVRNPYDLALIPGGSSGGNGAAIAARMCPVGLGTDTGASVRIPSALCGIVGLRPTMGRYSQQGIVPFSHTRDTAGPMARSVRDLVLLDSVIVGSRAAVPSARLKGQRVGVPRGYFFDDLDSSLVPVVAEALARLRGAGCTLVEAEIPDLEKLYVAATAPITYYEMLHDLSRYLRSSGSHLTLRDVVEQIASPDVKSLYETFVIGPQAPTRATYDTAMTQGRPALQAAYRTFFRQHDVAVIAFPTTLLPARPIGDDVEVELNGKRVNTFSTYLHNTRPMATAGIPGLSFPIGLTAAGLPAGLEFDAPEGQDRALLSFVLAVEALFKPIPSPY